MVPCGALPISKRTQPRALVSLCQRIRLTPLDHPLRQEFSARLYMACKTVLQNRREYSLAERARYILVRCSFAVSVVCNRQGHPQWNDSRLVPFCKLTVLVCAAFARHHKADTITLLRFCDSVAHTIPVVFLATQAAVEAQHAWMTQSIALDVYRFLGALYSRPWSDTPMEIWRFRLLRISGIAYPLSTTLRMRFGLSSPIQHVVERVTHSTRLSILEHNNTLRPRTPSSFGEGSAHHRAASTIHPLLVNWFNRRILAALVSSIGSYMRNCEASETPLFEGVCQELLKSISPTVASRDYSCFQTYNLLHILAVVIQSPSLNSRGTKATVFSILEVSLLRLISLCGFSHGPPSLAHLLRLAINPPKDPNISVCELSPRISSKLAVAHKLALPLQRLTETATAVVVVNFIFAFLWSDTNGRRKPNHSTATSHPIIVLPQMMQFRSPNDWIMLRTTSGLCLAASLATAKLLQIILRHQMTMVEHFVESHPLHRLFLAGLGQQIVSNIWIFSRNWFRNRGRHAPITTTLLRVAFHFYERFVASSLHRVFELKRIHGDGRWMEWLEARGLADGKFIRDSVLLSRVASRVVLPPHSDGSSQRLFLDASAYRRAIDRKI